MFTFLRREPGFYKRLFKLSLPMILQLLEDDPASFQLASNGEIDR